MSKFVQDFEDDQFQNTVISQSSNESPNPVEHGADGLTPTITSSKKKRNLPGNPGKNTYLFFEQIVVILVGSFFTLNICHRA
ncbi:hypothetical protein CRYUN_Cryun06bG0097800 [Craigia yunnanensis]